MLLGMKLTANIAPVLATIAPVLTTRGMVRQTSTNMADMMYDVGCVLFGGCGVDVGMRRSERQSD